MTLKSILCAYSGDPEKGSGLRHAIRLANRHGAHLTGVAKTAGLGFLHRQLPAHVSDTVRAQLDENGRRMLAETAERFTTMATEASLDGASEFVELDPSTDGPIASFARAFDLVVIGYHHGTIYEDDYASNPDLIALRSGRPVLIVPNGYDGPQPPSKTIVAWDGKRAATRALSAAIALFETGSEVVLLSVGTTPRNTDPMLRNLARHGVKATAETVAQDGRIADTILSHAQRLGADLIVMGAFEHSKFSHDIIGGATTDVLDQATVPVMMAH